MPADGTFSAHIVSQGATNPWAKVGVMLRASTDPGAPYYATFVTPGNGVAVQWRTAAGTATSQLVQAGTAPTYLMVGRWTNTATATTFYTAYTSPDGATWTPIPGSSQAIAMPGSLLAGMAITSHLQGTGSSVTFDTVTLTAAELVPAGQCASGWTCADIGAATPAGSQSVDASGNWTIEGGGGDIWGTFDEFHFAWQQLAADGTVTADVASQTPTDPYAKAGVMLRLTSDPASPYYAVLVTPGHGVTIQYRDAQGDGSTSPAGVGGTVPLYVQITRAGTTYSAATSTDGVTWTLVPGSAMTLANLTGSLQAGLAVTSHVTTSLSTAVFTGVAVS